MEKLTIKNITHILLTAAMFIIPSQHVLAEETDVSEAEKQKPSICESMNGEAESLLDEAHTYISIQFCEPAVWFDSFFSDERADEEIRAGTSVRWQNDYVLSEGGIWEYTANVRASYKLPNAKKSINLIFEGEQEESVQDIIPDNEEEVRGDLGILYEITRSDRANFSVRVKLSPSITLRYRYRWPISETFSTRFTQELFRRDNANGATSRIDFEKRINKDFLLRQSNAITSSENLDGREWQNSLVLYQHLTDKSALSYESSVSGVTEPETYTRNTRLGVRYRQNFYRKWLFYEIAPAVNWNKALITDGRLAAWEILFRLEINFVNF